MILTSENFSVYLKACNKQLENFLHAVTFDAVAVPGRALPVGQVDAYKAYLMGTDRNHGPFQPFRKAVLNAAKKYSTSPQKLADALLYHKRVLDAADTFIQAANAGHPTLKISVDIFDELSSQGKTWVERITHIENPMGQLRKSVLAVIYNKAAEVADKLGIAKTAFDELYEESKVLEMRLETEAFERFLNITPDNDDLRVRNRKINTALNKLLGDEFDALLKKVEQEVWLNHKEQFHPLVLWMREIEKAAGAYMENEYQAADLEQLKQTVVAATDELAAYYNETIEPSVLDYIKAAGLILVGLLIALPTCPALISSNYRNCLKLNFFSWPAPSEVDSEKGRQIRAELEATPYADEVSAAAESPIGVNNP